MTENLRDKLLEAAKAWRAAEVTHAGIELGITDGDEQEARAASIRATHQLRIACDKYFKSVPAT